MLKLLVLFVLIILCVTGYAQTVSTELNDSLFGEKRPNEFWCESHQFKVKQVLLPFALAGIGLIGVESDWMQYQNKEVRNELQESIDGRVTIDDFTQYAPLFSVYALNLLGVKGKHNYLDRTIILTTSALLMGAVTNSLKYTTRVMRPDESTRNSFPSGHTATAFMGAEFLRMEFRDVSPWIGYAGYIVATGTGFLRMYNNRHWFNDVLSGAGIGILSARAGYWLFPMIQKSLHRKFHCNMMLSPYVTSESKGMNLVVGF